MTAALRVALEAALPDLTVAQAHAARDLLDALTPPMEEPTWPGAPVIAMCGNGRIRLHVRRSDGPNSGWECALYCTSIEWSKLINPRPLTPAEYAEHGIPMPCEHVADEETVERATQAFREHQGDVPESMRAALIAGGFKAAER